MESTNTMQYMQVVGKDKASSFELATTTIPTPRSYEVLIKVMVAGINRPDVLQRMGAYPAPADASPIIGLEVSGEVVAMGEDVKLFKIGDKVCGLTNGGGYAQYCSVPATQCLPWPKDYDAIKAAALPETYFTVWANLFQAGKLKKGESVLIHGGTSGIGSVAIQLAVEFGCTVYATAGSQEKCEACIKLGAKNAINYKTEDFEVKIREYTLNKGVNVVLDMVGAPYTMRNIWSLALDGRLIQIATMEGYIVNDFDLRQVMTKRLIVTGSTMRPRTAEQKGDIAAALYQKVWPILNEGRCAPVIDQVFPLKDAIKAHELMESGKHIGKIMLQVS